MSVIGHSTLKNVNFSAKADRADRAPIASPLPAIVGLVRNAMAKSTRLLMHAAQAAAEARMQRAMIEAELYRKRYKHSSKNDDDLPIVGLPIVGLPIGGPASAEQPAPIVSPRVSWRRAAGAAVAMAKRVFPVILGCAILATVLAATIAIKLAIWLPLYRH